MNQIRMTPAALKAALDGDMANCIRAMTPGGIEAQEAEGQRELNSVCDRLPIRGTIDDPVKRAQWESVGFVFGKPIPELSQRGREVFAEATFPKGWSLKPSGHSMWSSVVDDQGRKRAKVFFKAAFYDFNAHTFGLECRYGSGSTGGQKDGEPVIIGVFDSDNTPIHQVATYPTWDDYYADSNYRRHSDAANKWLDEHYPNNRDPMAYWESQS